MKFKKDVNEYLEDFKEFGQTFAIKPQRLSVLLKPTEQCNMECIYCFDRKSKQFFHQKDNLYMSIETFEKQIDFLSRSSYDVQITFHGGEQTLQTTSWYKQQFEILEKYKNVHQNSVQSNGFYLRDDLLELFHENNINMSFSFDGIYNDTTRGNEGKILSNIKKYNDKYNTKTGIILMINKYNYNNLLEEYKYLASLDLFSGVQMNHLHDTLTNEVGIPDVDEYIETFKELQQYYLTNKDDIDLRIVEQYLNVLSGCNKQLCSYSGNCVQHWLGIYPNGDIQVCDYYYDNPDMIYGNVYDFMDVTDLYKNSQNYINFKNSMAKRKQYCRDIKCSIYDYCKGGCNSQTYSVSKQIERPNPEYCDLRRREIIQILEVINEIPENRIANNLKDKISRIRGNEGIEQKILNINS